MTVMENRFAPLRRALDAWEAAERTARFFWRDDDAAAATPQLERLLTLADAVAAPLLLAVIPERAETALAARLAGSPRATVGQHGWSHANHAPPGDKKCELHAARPRADVLAELAAGRARLRELFGERFLPVMIPPWNRLAPDIAAALPGLGFHGLSTHAERRFAVAGLIEVNTHIDPQDRRVAEPQARFDAAVEQTAARLDKLRREKRWEEPTGLLTHHLTMDAATWDFVAALTARLRNHETAAWTAPQGLFSVD